jgi:hypothetical protein
MYAQIWLTNTTQPTSLWVIKGQIYSLDYCLWLTMMLEILIWQQIPILFTSTSLLL